MSEELFEYASSIKSIKTPELRKRAKAVLTNLGYTKKKGLGYYYGVWQDQEYAVDVDCGGRSQFRYGVEVMNYNEKAPYAAIYSFERALGGFVNWNFIVEENVDEVFQLFEEVIKYSILLPKRIVESLSGVS